MQGPPGIGKTRLLAAAREAAATRGMEVLAATGSELERDFGFGAVRQLFEERLRTAGARERDELLSGAAAAAGAVLASDSDARASQPEAVTRGLYWLAANLAERRPLLVAVDDLHWADEASLRWIEHTARRLDGVPLLLLVAAARPVAPAGESPSLTALAAAAEVRRLEPRELSSQATAELVRARLGPEADDELCAACHSVTRGNPFLLAELLAALAADRVEHTAAGATRVRNLGPETIARSVLLRFGAMSAAAAPLARAVAVLGDGAPLPDAAELARLAADEAARAAEELVSGGVFEPGEPLRFVHPVVRASVRDDIPAAERALAHRQAARLLHSRGAGLDAVVVQLLASSPGGETWPVDMLRDAARRAVARGAPDAAVAYLRRALEEPPSRRARGQVLFELANAEALDRSPAALDHLWKALEETHDPRARARITLALTFELGVRGESTTAVELMEEAIGSLDPSDRDLRLELEAQLLGVARNGIATHRASLDRLARLEREVAGETPAERAVLANLAFSEAVAGGSARRAAELSRRALADGQLLQDVTADSLAFYFAVNGISLTDHFDEAEEHLRAALADARRRDSPMGFALASCFRAHMLARRGLLAETEADARAALEIFDQGDLGLVAPTVECLVLALVGRGELPEAEAALAPFPRAPEAPDAFPYCFLMSARAELLIAQRRPADALEELMACGRRTEHWGLVSPAFLPWRSRAALAQLTLGRRAEAELLVAEDLAAARRFGARRATGIALHAKGLIDGGEAGVETLRVASVELEAAGALLDEARALADLGAALRRTGRRAESREPLERAQDLAHACRATVLERRARDELAAAGARPRSVVRSGVDALTPSESRAARMAAEGMSNREIAQALFVTVKTVEVHLTRAYAKLDVTSRAELPAALGGDAAPV